MTLKQFIPLAVAASLFALVFSLGLRATFGDALYLLRRPGLLLRSLLSMNVVMLAFAVVVDLLFPIAHPVKVALVALAVSPVPPILPGKQMKAGGSEAYAIGLLVSASVAALLIVPLALSVVGAVFQAEYHAPFARVLSSVLVSIVLPLALGMLVQRLWPAAAGRIAGPVSLVATVLLVLACLPVVFMSWAAFWAQVGNGVIVFLVLFTLTGIAAGHWLGGPDPGERTVLALATGTRHPGIAIAIASFNFPDEKAALAVVLWHLIIGAIVSIPYVRWRRATRGT